MEVFMKYELYNNIKEIQNLYSLWQECFGDSKSYTDFYFQWKLKDNQVLTVYQGDKLSSMLHLNPYRLMVEDKNISSNYIVGVATKPEDRRKGLMKMMLEAAILQMYHEHMPFTYLMPAAEEIYIPFGFRIVYEQESWTQDFMIEKERVRNKSISNKGIKNKLEVNEYSVIALGRADNIRLEELVDFSNQLLAKEYDVFVDRTSDYYIRLIHEMESTGGEVLICYHKERLVGFTAYMAEGNIYITEAIYNSDEKKEVMEAITEFIIRNEDVLIEYSETVEEKENHNPPTIMTRIVNWESFVSNISASCEMEIVIEVRDSIIEQNNGTYTLQFSQQGCRVTRSNKNPEVSADIADLTSFFFGRFDSQNYNKINCSSDKGNTNEKLSQINVYKRIFINDVV